MKTLLTTALATLFLVARSVAASDADVTIVKAYSVVIEEDKVTIVADAKTRITLIHGDHDPSYKGQQWHGMPAEWAHIIGNRITFVIKRRADNPLPKVWEETRQLAKDLQEGKEVGRIGFHEPEMTIKGNMLTSMSGTGYLYPKGK